MWCKHLLINLIIIGHIIMLSVSWKYPSIKVFQKLKRKHIQTGLRLFCATSNGSSNKKRTLLQDLQHWRKRTSDEMQKPAYRVINNQALELVAQAKPTSLEQLSALSGFGHRRLQLYGRMILDTVLMHTKDVDLNSSAVIAANADSDKSFWEKYDKPVKKSKVKRKVPSTTPRRRPVKQLSEAALSTLDLPPVIQFEDLNKEKQAAVPYILEGNNVFLTGSAGTGKTLLLRYVIQELLKLHGDDGVAITAPTGIAAITLGGQTIHSFAGIGLGNGEPNVIVQKVLKSSASSERWKKCKVLIIDEISMLDKPLFELLDLIARSVRKDCRPFGGLQVVLVGDFMQLPPVRYGGNCNFAYNSSVWDALGLSKPSASIYLRQVVRQSDTDFVKHLNQIRGGVVNQEFLNLLSDCLVDRKPKPTNGIIPTKLYAVNKEVDTENLARLDELNEESVFLQAHDTWKVKPVKKSLSSAVFHQALNSVIPYKIELKIGAQVMLLRNRNRMTYGGASSGVFNGQALVNGSRGKVISFSESVRRPGLMIPTVQFDNGMTTTIGPVDYSYRDPGGDGEMIRSQVPLKLAWATTIHKSQGCTLTSAELMLDQTFDYGQVYVALSRVKSLEGLWMSRPLKRSSIRVNPSVLQFYKNLTAQQKQLL